MAEKVTRVFHSQGLNAAKYNRLARSAVLCGQVRADAWQRCSGVATASQSPYDIRDAWMAEGYDWHGLPARLGKATLADALGDIDAAREASKVPVKKAIRHRTRGNRAECERLYSLLKQNRWTEDPFLHRQMRKQWRGGRSHVLYMPYRDVRALLAERTRTAVGIAPPGLELRGHATEPPSTESESPAPVPKCTR
ncbi:MAG: hypothetical protein F4Y80_12795 [Caldilineaceae bacterium SB0665_bin_21]|nr:hypothetical protein [Caldilineaceae bacterium SB0665_bin_21]